MWPVVGLTDLKDSVRTSTGIAQHGRWDMRSVRWLPMERREETDNRPFLEAPSPWDYRPEEMPKADSREDDESPRVIVIEI